MRNFYTKIALSAYIALFSSYAIAVDDHDHGNHAGDSQFYDILMFVFMPILLLKHKKPMKSLMRLIPIHMLN